MKQLSINLLLLFVLALSSLNGFGQDDQIIGTDEGTINNTSKNKTTSDPNVPLFEVKNADNKTVFAVYPTGVKIFIDESQTSGNGFSVEKMLDPLLNQAAVNFFTVNPGSVRVFIPELTTPTKAGGGGFSVGRLGTNKTTSGDFFSVYPGNVRINLEDEVPNSSKAGGGGFSVGRLGTNKSSPVDFLRVTPDITKVGVVKADASNNGGFSVQKLGTSSTPSEELFQLNTNNTFLGNESGKSINDGLYNAFLGFESGINTTDGNSNTFVGYNSGKLNITGNRNVAIGEKAGFSSTTANYNTFIGTQAGENALTGYNTSVGYLSGQLGANGTNRAFFGYGAGNNNSGDNNTFIGVMSGFESNTGANNVYLGAGAGKTAKGSGNIIIGKNAGENFTGSNALIIDNSNTNAPLIFGDFLNNKIRINGKVGINRNCESNDFEVEGRVSKTTAGNWNSNSDRRIKTEITDISNALDIIMKLRPVKFKYTEEWKKSHPTIEDKFYYNYIAQEYQNVFPESVYKSGEYLANDKKEILQIDTYNAQIVSIKAIQDLVNQSSKQQEEINNLKAIVDKLSNEKQALNEKQQTIEAKIDAMNNELVQLKSMIIQSGK